MSEELEVFNKLAEAETIPDFSVPFTGNYELDQQIVEHKAWLKSIRHEQPSPKRHYRVGIYIRYFNQTKHDNYLDYHIRQYQDTMALLPSSVRPDWRSDLSAWRVPPASRPLSRRLTAEHLCHRWHESQPALRITHFH